MHSMVIAALLSTLVVPFATIVFGIVRFTLPLVYKLPLLHNFLRPFTAHFLRGPWTLLLPFRHISLLIRAWFVAFTTIATWEYSNATFETFIYNPLSINGATPEPHVALVSGVASNDLGFRYLAYKDIREFATGESESAFNQRSALFNDQKYHPNLWSHMLRESLLFLGKDYQHLLRRGKPPPPPPTAKSTTPATSATPSRPSLAATPTPLIRASIFQSAKPASPIRNVVDSLGSDGPLAQALDAGAEAAHIPELFRSVESKLMPTPVKEEVKKSADKVESLVERYMKQAKEEIHEFAVTITPVWAAEYFTQLRTWWTRERLERSAQSHLPNVELDVVIVDVLSNLICASLTEDKYGVVQRDIPKTLEALLSFLSALQAYSVEVRAKYTPPIQDQVYTPEQIAEAEVLRVEVDKACDVLNYLSEVYKKQQQLDMPKAFIAKRTPLKRITPTGVRRFFFKLELLSKRRPDLPYDYSNLDPVVDTPPAKVPPRILSQSYHEKENRPPSPPMPAFPTSNIRTAPWPCAERIALMNEDYTEDVVVITTLDSVPFCCHEDLVTMSREQLIGVAQCLNARLPSAMAIDIDSVLTTSWIRHSIERLVGLRPDVPQAPKVYRRMLTEREADLRTDDWRVHLDRTPPTSPLASRSQSYAQLGSLISPGLDRLVEEEAEDTEETDDDDDEADRQSSKRRRMIFDDTAGDSDSDVDMSPEQTPTPLPRLQRARSHFLDTKTSPTPTRVFRSRSHNIDRRPAINASLYKAQPPNLCNQNKANLVMRFEQEFDSIKPIGAPRRSGRLRPVLRPRGNAPSGRATAVISAKLGANAEQVIGAKRKRHMESTEGVGQVTSGFDWTNMRRVGSDGMDEGI
ncbi:hypothetical protein H0H87_004698 [Tephrocybe sp. NHM501043]|nr:hypothetical protein H0H87_004698 [Tephrocybe sp. NHM501043]